MYKYPYNNWDSKTQAHWPLIKYQFVNGSIRVNPRHAQERISTSIALELG